MIELTSENYQAEVVESKLPVVVDFWSMQCARCMALMPVVERLAEANEKRMTFGKVNCPKNRKLIANLGGEVQSLPTFLFYKEGKIVTKLVGQEITEKDIADNIEKLLQ